MSQALHPMLNIAIKAARAAGAVINRASLDLERIGISTKAPNDFVTEVDQAAEAVIIDTLLTAYPGHGILAEESGRSRGAKDSDYVWIIDPLDGTTNFIHGFPVYAVSIALSFRGQIQQAVVYDPARNDLFYASKGKGAYLNDRRIRVSKRARMAESLIGTGFPFRRGDNFQRYLKMFELLMPLCAGLRRPGAASLDLCYVAAGYYEGFFETGLSPWDVAAGALMITEAGGLIGNFTGEADFLHQREVVAGNPRIYGQLVSLLAPFSRVIKDEGKDALPAEAAPSTAVARAEDDAPLRALRRAVDEAVAQGAAPPRISDRADRADRVTAPQAAPQPYALLEEHPGEATAAGTPDAAAVEPVAPAVKRAPVRIRKADLPAPPAEASERPPRDARRPDASRHPGERGRDGGPERWRSDDRAGRPPREGGHGHRDTAGRAGGPSSGAKPRGAGPGGRPGAGPRKPGPRGPR